MTRKETIEYIRDNSRLNQSAKLGKFTIEHRIGFYPHPFVLLDMGDHGFEIYYAGKENKIDALIEEFKQNVGQSPYYEESAAK